MSTLNKGLVPKAKAAKKRDRRKELALTKQAVAYHLHDKNLTPEEIEEVAKGFMKYSSIL